MRQILPITVLASVLFTPAIRAQKRQFEEKPLLQAWFRVDESTANEYILSVLNEYDIGDTYMARAIEATRDVNQTKPQLQGMLVYMAKGFLPSAAQLQFRSVTDEAEFRRLVLAVKRQFGGTATLSGGGDHYSLDIDFSKGIPLPGLDADETHDEVTTIPIVDKDELQRKPEMLAGLSMTMRFRLHDGVMFSGQFAELEDMELPSFNELRPGKGRDSYDVLAEFDLTVINEAFKGLFFNAIDIAAFAKLQQYDDEEDVPYARRRASGEMALAALRTLVYDIKGGRFWVKLARDDQPVRLRLELNAKSGSDLARLGESLGRGETRFGAIRDRKAPFTICSTWEMPPKARKMFETQVALARFNLEADNSASPTALTALYEMEQVLLDTVENGQTDSIFQLAGDVSSGFAFIGAVQLESATQFQEALAQWLDELPDSSTIDQTTDDQDRRYVRIATGDMSIPDSDERFSSTFNFTAFDSCLWFSIGGSDACQKLIESVQLADGTRRERTFGDPLQVKFDLKAWLAEGDTPQGMNQLPRQTLIAAEREFDKSLTQAFSRGRAAAKEAPLERRRSFFERALQHGETEVDFRIQTNGERVAADLEIGLGMANLIVARVIDLQGRAISMLQRRGETLDSGDETEKEDG